MIHILGLFEIIFPSVVRAGIEPDKQPFIVMTFGLETIPHYAHLTISVFKDTVNYSKYSSIQ
jgi:hypothetical protein